MQLAAVDAAWAADDMPGLLNLLLTTQHEKHLMPDNVTAAIIYDQVHNVAQDFTAAYGGVLGQASMCSCQNIPACC